MVERHLLAAAISSVLLFGNAMLVVSLWTLLLIGWYLTAFTLRGHLRPGFVGRGMHVFAAVLVAALLKAACSMVVEDDGHIYKLARAKLGSFQDFMTGLYLCTDTYRAMDWRTVEALMAGFLPQAACVVAVLAVRECLSAPRDDAQTRVCARCINLSMPSGSNRALTCRHGLRC